MKKYCDLGQNCHNLRYCRRPEFNPTPEPLSEESLYAVDDWAIFWVGLAIRH